MMNCELGIRNGGFLGGFFEAHICDIWALLIILLSSVVICGVTILQDICKAGNDVSDVIGDGGLVIGDLIAPLAVDFGGKF